MVAEYIDNQLVARVDCVIVPYNNLLATRKI